MNFINKFINRIFNSRKMSAQTIPLVVIIGCTGCGKSRLAIEIANKFNGEIISADSMQVYKGLDIITNKVSYEERQQVKHHLIDVLDPLSRFTVVDFRNRALKLIKDIIANNKIPIIVGGTNYYIESILWNILIDDNIDQNKVNTNQQLVYDRDNELIKNICANIDDDNLTKDNLFRIPITYESVDAVSSDRLYNILKEIDPNSAQLFCSKEKRKIIRCLQVYQKHKKLYSELLEEQRSVDGGSDLGGPLRFNNSLMLWLQCDETVLNERLDKRVDEMMEQGLIDELLNFHHNYNKHRLTHNLVADYTKGLFQSIGFKEFHKYLILSDEQRKNLVSNDMLIRGTKDMKYITRKYARKQIKWIRNRFLKLNGREVPKIYGVNCTDLDQWTTNVREPAFSIVDSYLNNTPVSDHFSPVPQLKLPRNTRQQYFCEICEKTLMGDIALNAHRNAKQHKWHLKQNHKRKEEYRKLISLLECHQNNLNN